MDSTNLFPKEVGVLFSQDRVWDSSTVCTSYLGDEGVPTDCRVGPTGSCLGRGDVGRGVEDQGGVDGALGYEDVGREPRVGSYCHTTDVTSSPVDSTFHPV